ncbi:MAG: TrmB family transcriptional regulator [Candidatus Helarchaeota archaeon]
MMKEETEIIEAMQKVGFRENDAKVYFTLVRLGIAKMVDLTDETKIQRPRIYDSLDRLEKLGLILKDTTYPTPRYRALSPDSIFMLMQNDFSQKINILEKVKTNLAQYQSIPPKREFATFKFDLDHITRYASEIIKNSNRTVRIVLPTFQSDAFNSIINIILETFHDQKFRFILILPQQYLIMQKLELEFLKICNVFLWTRDDEIPYGLISNDISQALQIFPSDCVFISNINIIPQINQYVRLLEKLASPITLKGIERAVQFKTIIDGL